MFRFAMVAVGLACIGLVVALLLINRVVHHRFHDRTEEILDDLALTQAVMESNNREHHNIFMVESLLMSAANTAYTDQLDHLDVPIAVAWIRNRVDEKLSFARMQVAIESLAEEEA